MLQSLFSRVLGRLCTVVMIVVYVVQHVVYASVQVHAVHSVSLSNLWN